MHSLLPQDELIFPTNRFSNFSEVYIDKKTKNKKLLSKFTPL